MDEPTRQIYESRADEWVRRRTPEPARADDFASRTTGPTADVGCGPGWYAARLAPPVLAIDAAYAMLRLTRHNAPAASCIQADLTHLPLRRGVLGAAWATHSLQHVPRAELPGALAHLHWSMRVGARLLLRVPEGDTEGHRSREGEDFPGRYFALWSRDAIVEVIGGAGFDVERAEVHENRNSDRILEIEAVRARTLPDLVAPGLRLLVCGLNPSLYAADAGVGFARPGNRFWPAALAAGLVSRDRDPWHAFAHHGVGFTDLVKRATVAADELTRDEYRDGMARVRRLAAWLQPAAVVFVGLAGWRAAVDRRAQPGPQPTGVGGRPAYVMPSTSGLNARVPLDELTDHLRAAVALA